jgi:putative ABC transport system permease protein
METLWRDVRQTLRWMMRQKGFTAAACLTLALGIGANTAIFSIVWGVLLKPLPYADPERLVQVSEEHPTANAPMPGAYFSDVTLESWSRSMRTLERVAAYSDGVLTVGREEPERLPGAAVSPALFPLLRVAPAAGRFFLPEEATKGAPCVVVLSHALWSSRFGSRPAAVGRSLFVEGRPCSVVGVAPPGFSFPAPGTALWLPYVIAPPPQDPQQRGIETFSALGRLRPGVTPLQAAAEGTAAARAVPRPMAADLLFGKGKPVEVRVRPFGEATTARVRPALVVLAVGVGLVLLIACANVSNLFLARSLARRRELAIRAALGASRGRLAAQLFTESLVLSLCGGALGLLLAWGLAKALPALAPDDLPRLEEIRLDGRVLAFAGVISVYAGLLSGLLPTWRGLHVGPAPALHEGDHRVTSGAGKGLRSSLLVAEAALAVVLLIGAGLLARSFGELLAADGGYDPEHVLTARLFLPDAGENPARNFDNVDAILARLRALPGVAAAGAANMAPLGGSTTIRTLALPAGGPGGAPTMIRATAWTVTPDYGRAAGLHIRSGRFLEAGDVTAGTQALVVNEELVRLYLTDGRPVVGRRWSGAFGAAEQVTEIVGVVANVLKDGVDRLPQPEIYLPARRTTGEAFQQPYLLVRTTGDPLALAPDLRRLVREIEPHAALDDVGRLTGRLSAAVAQPRFAALVTSAFAALALLLAATGLYGVLTYSVSQRRREMGIRGALGATRAGLLGLVLREGLLLTVAGLVLGLGAALAVTRLMASLLFGVTPLDAVSFAAAPLAMLGVAAAACLIPAYRAAAVDPAEALRSE